MYGRIQHFFLACEQPVLIAYVNGVLKVRLIFYHEFHFVVGTEDLQIAPQIFVTHVASWAFNVQNGADAWVYVGNGQ